MFNTIRRLTRFSAAAFVLAFTAGAAGTTLPIQWTGAGGNDLWSNPYNWDEEVVPDNVGSLEFNVDIPANAGTVQVDLADCEITELTLGANTTLAVLPAYMLTVLETCEIFGKIDAEDGDFFAEGEGALLAGDKAHCEVTSPNDTATVSIGNPLTPYSYTTTGFIGTSGVKYNEKTWDRYLLTVSGADALLDLSAAESIDATFDSPSYNDNRQYITASSGAALDLPNVLTLGGPTDEQDYLQIKISDATTDVDLSSLYSLTSASRGRTRLILRSGAVLSMPSLETIETVEFDLNEGSQLFVDGVAAATYSSVDYIGTAGVKYNDKSWDKYLMTVSGEDTLLDLSAVESIDATFNSPSYNDNRQHITASSGAALDLSNVLTLGGPTDEQDYLQIMISDAATHVDLSSLYSLTSASRGRTRLILRSGAALSMPSLETIETVEFNLNEGSQLFVDGVAAATYSSVDYIGTAGVKYNDKSWDKYLMTVSGEDTLLDLSAVESIDATFNSPSYNDNRQHITASSGAALDLSNVLTLGGPTDEQDYLQIMISDAATHVDLSSLYSLTRASRGRTRLILRSGAALSMPSLETIETVEFNLNEGSQLFVDGVAAATYSSVDYIGTAGVKYNDKSWDKYLMTVSGEDTLLDLSAVESIDATFNSPSYNDNRQHITASSSAVLDLSGVQSVTGPVDGVDYLAFAISDNGLINLSSLGTVSSAGSGLIRFDLTTGGQIRTGSLLAQDPTIITLSDSACTLDVDGTLYLNAALDLVVPNGANIKIGQDLLHMHENEVDAPLGASGVHFDGEGTEQEPQWLEVGGLDVDIYAQVLNNHNFGFGQLVIGDPDQPTVVRLQDEYDNNADCEALYLWGSYKWDGPDPSLIMYGGSTLILDEIDVYLFDGNEWVSVKDDWFDPGEDVIHYTDHGSDGYIALGEDTCPADTDCDGLVDVDDLFAVLAEWGPCDDCHEDTNGDGLVDIDDLFAVLGDWGPCP